MWTRTHLRGVIPGALVGLVLSFSISYYFWYIPPTPIEDLSLVALNQLHSGQYKEASDNFTRAIAIDPRDPLLWEGKAYSHLGVEYSTKFNLNSFHENFLLKRKSLSGEISHAWRCAQHALRNSRSTQELIRANLASGIVLDLAGYDDYGADRHGLAPMRYYTEAYILASSGDRSGYRFRSIDSVTYGNHGELARLGIVNRLSRLHNTSEQLRMLEFYFGANSSLIQDISAHLKSLKENQSSGEK